MDVISRLRVSRTLALIVTVMGLALCAANHSSDPTRSEDRSRSRLSGQDEGRSVSAVVNGKTTISIADDQVLIDVTDGTIDEISFKRVSTKIAEAGGQNPVASTGHEIGNRWQAGWNKSWYRPFMMSRWAYDSSTITKWIGLGALLFVVRLVLALFLGFLDFLLCAMFLVGQLLIVCFGPGFWPGGLG